MPPPNRRKRGDAALRRQVQEWLDKMTPGVEEAYGPRQLDPAGRSIAALKARRAQLIAAAPMHARDRACKARVGLDVSSESVSAADLSLKRKLRALGDMGEEISREELKRQLARARGEPSALADLSCIQLEELRHETTAALGRVDAAATAAVARERERQAECMICREAERTSALVPCGHNIACHACASEQRICPICRAPVESVLRIFHG